MVRVGLVGFGGYGWTLVDGLRSLSEKLDFRIVCAADTRLADLPERGELLAAEGAKLFDDAMEMYQAMRGKCDAVYIATSIHSHMPLTLAAVENSYHVHLEKPAAATVQEVDRMIDAVQAADRLCLVGFQAMHGADLLAIKDRICSGRLGRVHTLACCALWPRTDAYYARNEWAARLQCGRNWVLDSPTANALAHQVNNMLFWAGDAPRRYATPAAVRAELYAARKQAPEANRSHDTAAIEILTDSGPRAYFLASHCSEDTRGPMTTIVAENGRVEWTIQQGATIRYADGTEEVLEKDTNDRHAMIENFIEAVRTGSGEHLRCTLHDARNMVLALDGAHESSRRVHEIPPSAVRSVGEGDQRRDVIERIDALLTDAAARPCLLSDLPDAPAWCAATEPFAMDGYDTFPRQFAACGTRGDAGSP